MIRVASLPDAKQIYDIEWGSIECACTQAQIEDALNNPRYLYVVEEGLFAIVGYAGARLVETEAEIHSIAVAPHFRRRGIARGLLNELLDRLKKRGAKTFFIEVDPDNTPALLLYQSFGFVKVNVRKDYYGGGKDALILKLDDGS